jgi:hypothetical protein
VGGFLIPEGTSFLDTAGRQFFRSEKIRREVNLQDNLILFEMSQFSDAYKIVEAVDDLGILYFFVSKGKQKIIKIIQYTYVQDLFERKLYNLGFSDFDSETSSTLDNHTSNNGDHYRIFHTVLNTIPVFFDRFPDAMIVVKGSDSKETFMMDCMDSCEKNCDIGQCKKAHRRIKLYKSYVERHYNTFMQDYRFFASKEKVEDELIIEGFLKGENYYAILMIKVL